MALTWITQGQASVYVIALSSTKIKVSSPKNTDIFQNRYFHHFHHFHPKVYLSIYMIHMAQNQFPTLIHKSPSPQHGKHGETHH